MRFQGMNSGDREGTNKKLRKHGWTFRSLVPLGTPSAWLFLIRLHACRAGLRFARQDQYTSRIQAPKEIKEYKWNDAFVALKTGPGDRNLCQVGASATVEEKGRPGTRLRRIASGRKQTQVLRPKRSDTDRR
jgi:hypothetical protein